MTRRSRAIAAGAVLAVLAASGCAARPDTALHPEPPARTFVPLRHPFRDARLVVDRDTAAGRWQTAHRATWLDPITSAPQARWLNGPQDLTAVPALMNRAARTGTLPVFVAYYVPNRGCSGFAEGAPRDADYDAWIDGLIRALGATASVVVMEPDAVLTDCFTNERAALLARSVRRLTDAGHSVYLDAGHANWRPSGEVAERLLRAGIEHAEGFAVNVANRQTTEESYRWARELSDLVGDREFVIDTSRNGLGAPPDEPGRDDEWCNPAHQALGEAPTTAPGRPGLAALLWIKPPGESDGHCGGETTYLFSPGQASNLVANTPWVPEPVRRLALAARTDSSGQS
ncbi:glycoside hydrolase family 6 protein [Dactylosporangium sp. CS-047395]|uniref:glycoside hydrolase family 6 protein n=1 Tax=Dactylosporangium sp. CS-047395 TaxID=3239936 RepID=UPI003D9486FC